MLVISVLTAGRQGLVKNVLGTYRFCEHAPRRPGASDAVGCEPGSMTRLVLKAPVQNLYAVDVDLHGIVTRSDLL